MREILFRGKRTDNDNWTFGYYAEDPQLIDEHGNDSVCIVRINPHPCGYSLVCTPVFPESIGQYTGLTDKNGTKIFEGDIIKTEDRLVLVYWLEGNSQFDLKFVGRYNDIRIVNFRGINMRDLYNYKIIGNIYDNPELIK